MNVADKYYIKMTETKVSKLIIKLGIPTTISMLITNIYNLVDTYFVGTLGDSQQGAMGVLFTLQCIIQAFAFMLGHGSGTFISKALAQKDVKNATKYVSTAFYLGGAIGIILAAVGLILLEPFMLFLGSSNTILPYAKDYGLWVLISAPFMITSLVLNNCLRYEGKAFYSMIGLCAGSILNIFGDYILITKLNMGVFGAGMSTAISQIISFLILLILYLKQAQSTISIRGISKEIGVYIDIVKCGLPSLFRQGLAAISSGLLNNFTKPFGDAAMAAMSIVNKYTSFVLCVSLGIGQGLQPVAGFNYQAGKYSRVKKGLIFTIIFSTIISLSLAPIGLFMPDKILHLLQNSDDAASVIEIGKDAIRFATIGSFVMPLSVSANMLYQSIRKSLIASILSVLRSGAILIPVIFIYKFAGLELLGIKLAQPTSDLISSLISVPFILYFLLKTPNEDKKMLEIY